MSESSTWCHICRRGELRLYPEFKRLHRVTSDCKAWKPGGALGQCSSCGCIQKPVDSAWQEEIALIYQGYDLYHQSAGVEHGIFDQGSGHSQTRSSRLIAELSKQHRLPTRGSVLDLGCGLGSFLSTFGSHYPEWELNGYEISDKNRATVCRIPGVKNFFSGSLSSVHGTFSIVSLLHVLEHVPGPVEYVKSLHSLLAPEGILLVQVPDVTANYFDLMVADHCNHFSPRTLGQVLEMAGFKIRFASSSVLPKEITLLAASSAEHRVHWQELPDCELDDVMERLQSVKSDMEKINRSKRLGIFGTSIAATWLAASYPAAVSFFVDEDLQRVGKNHCGLPVYSPDKTPAGSIVYLATPRGIAEKISARLSALNLPLEFVLPSS